MKISAPVFLLAAALPSTALGAVSVKITDSKTAAFSVLVDGAEWLTSADTRFFVDGAWHNASAGSLTLTNSSTGHGSDIHGDYDEQLFSWTAGSSTPIETKIRVYNGFDSFVVFEQHFPSGASNTSVGERDEVNSVFPSFELGGGSESAKGYMVYQECMIADAHIGAWSKTHGPSILR